MIRITPVRLKTTALHRQIPRGRYLDGMRLPRYPIKNLFTFMLALR